MFMAHNGGYGPLLLQRHDQFLQRFILRWIEGMVFQTLQFHAD